MVCVCCDGMNIGKTEKNEPCIVQRRNISYSSLEPAKAVRAYDSTTTQRAVVKVGGEGVSRCGRETYDGTRGEGEGQVLRPARSCRSCGGKKERRRDASVWFYSVRSKASM
jgi:hypothetical protein